MKYLKPFKIFKEDAMASASTAGMGSVSSSQPGGFVGDTTTSNVGSGDIPFYLLRKGKRKKGNPSEVSDLRDLEEAEVEEVDDLRESKIFENQADVKYNWLVLYFDDISQSMERFFWARDMDNLYQILRDEIFKDEDEEITETNIPYVEWCGWANKYQIIRVGEKEPTFEIELDSENCWNDFLNFYNNVPVNESKKFPNIKKMEIDGFEVLMGRDADSNDYLTMQMRKDGDLWFHAQGFPGSHIILRCGDRIADQTTKKKVAELAAKNSKAAGLATVICCPIELVSKEPGSNPGKVKLEMNLNVEKIEINL